MLTNCWVKSFFLSIQLFLRVNPVEFNFSFVKDKDSKIKRLGFQYIMLVEVIIMVEIVLYF